MKSQDVFNVDGEIGARLRAERLRLGLNQTEMAGLGGIKLNTQSRYESGGLPSLEYLLRVENAGVDWIWIVTGRHAVQDRAPEVDRLIDSFVQLSSEAQQALLIVAAQMVHR